MKKNLKIKKIYKKLSVIAIIIFSLIFNVNTIFADTYSIEKTDNIVVFDKNNNIWNSKYFRIPSLQTLSDGTLLAFSDIRYNGSTDHGYIDIGQARSIDNGKIWDYKIVMKNDRINTNYSRVMDSTTVVTNTGRIIL